MIEQLSPQCATKGIELLGSVGDLKDSAVFGGPCADDPTQVRERLRQTVRSLEAVRQAGALVQSGAPLKSNEDTRRENMKNMGN